MVVELASDWLICTCNASLALAAGAASAIAAPAALSWQLRLAAAWLALRLAEGPSSTRSSQPQAHTRLPAPYGGVDENKLSQ